MSILKHLLIIATMFFCMSCDENKDIKSSFYHWKLNVDSVTDIKLLEKHKPHNIYLHIMDVSINGDNKTPSPQAQISIDPDDPMLRQNVIPVIFIHNNVIANSDSSTLEDLAKKIIQSKKDFYSYHHIKNDSQELQIDCDWLESHKDKYFHLLHSIKKAQPDWTLSVTLRLYPYKYRTTMGIPPVDYVSIMCYNMDNIKKFNIKSSIFDLQTLSDYISKVDKYPLPTKVALPIFGWWVWFEKENYQNIFYFTSDFKNNAHVEHSSTTHYRMTTDTSVQGKYIRRGDIIRDEFPTIEDLNKSKELLKKHIDFDEIIFYHWDNTLLNHYEKAIIQ